jgi:hypothetical protein
VNGNLAVNRLLGSASDSPFTHERQKLTGAKALVLTGGALTLSVVYSW